ncbi:MAG: serine/threonine-protein phosphatase, partial [Butyrivibrio sp.]|nr:serine/threonine-protein phosphatase [Butyrivibrio sp.]
EVGGDFFDYFRLGEDRFAFLVADVADKGAPAAMIMAISKSLIKLRASVGGTPGEVLKSVSEWLITDGSSVFVTAWLGILDLNSGEVAACNAGHTQPAILHVSGEEGYTLKKLPHGAAMGLMPGMKFRDFTLQLAPGDRISCIRMVWWRPRAGTARCSGRTG